MEKSGKETTAKKKKRKKNEVFVDAKATAEATVKLLSGGKYDSLLSSLKINTSSDYLI